MDALKISMSGLDVEWQRLQVIAENLANVNTSRTADGGTYRARRLVSGPRADFQTLLLASTARANGAEGMSSAGLGVQVLGVETASSGVRKVHEPDHPHADADGFVTYPEIDHAREMSEMIKASRVYEANLTAISIAQQMYTRAIDMGK